MKRLLLVALLMLSVFTHYAYAGIVFEPYQSIMTGSWPQAVAIADLNGDGKNDVVLTTSSYSNPTYDYKVFIFYQDSGGNLQPPVLYGGGNGNSVAIADMNNDGKKDIIVSTNSGIGILFQNADGTFGPMQEISSGHSSTRVKVRDINNDGVLDVVSLSYGNVDIFFGKPDGTFSNPVSYPVQGVDNISDIALADVNNDGLVDVVLNCFGQAAVLIQQPDGTFAAPYYLNVGSNDTALSIAAADINGDKLNEIIATTLNSHNLVIFQQNSAGGFRAPSIYNADAEPWAVIVADMNNDGRSDIVVAHSAYNAIGIYLQNVDGSLDGERLYSVSSNFSSSAGVAIGDINGDGLPDVVIADYNKGLVILRQSKIVCNYTLSASTANFSPGGGQSSFALTTNNIDCQWTALSNSDWIGFVEKYGDGSATISFTVSANTSGVPRTGTISIEGQIFTVTQPSCNYALSSSSSNFYGAGGVGTIVITSNSPDCPWNATSNESWIEILPTFASSYNGNAAAIFIVSAYSGITPRTGTINIAGQTYSVNQSTPAVAGGDVRDIGELWLNMGSTANAVSADGNVVVGTARNKDGAPRAFRWTYNGGIIDLGTLGAPMSDTYGISVSADGSVVVGTTSHYFDNSFSPARAYRWTQSDGMIDLGVVRSDAFSYGWSVSGDGKTTAGYEADIFSDTWRAVRWTGVGAMDYLGTLPNGIDYSVATGISANGSVIVGAAVNSAGDTHAFRWTLATGMVDLGTLPGGSYSFAYGVSADGGVIVGETNTSAGYTRAFRWTQATGMVDLGTFGGSNSKALAVSADGNVVVGGAEYDSFGNSFSFRWSQRTGLQTVSRWLADNGVNSVTIFGGAATGVSADGNVIVLGSKIARVNPSPTFTTVAPAGGDKSVNLGTASAEYAWTAVSNVPWITITSGSTGTGNVTVQYSVAPNNGWVRTGTLTVANQTFTVIQGTTLTRARIGVFRAGAWYVDRDETFGWSGCGPDGCYSYGMAEDQSVTGDWDGTGIVRLGVFRNGSWYLDYNGDGQWSGCGTTSSSDRCYTFGMAGDIPVVGDWNGNGVSKIGVFRNGNWYLDYNGDGQWSGCGTTPSTDRCYTFGMAGDVPVVGDWNGNGVSKIGVFRNGSWYLDYNGDGQWSGCGTTPSTDRCYTFGMAGDIPVVGDWNGNGVPKIGVFRSGMWYLDYAGTNNWVGCGAPADTSKDVCAVFGMSGDVPIVLR